MTKRPIIAVTMGDPAGVGPELCLRILSDPVLAEVCVPVVFGDPGVLLKAANATRLLSPSVVMTLDTWRRKAHAVEPAVVDCGAIRPGAFEPGRVNAECGRASVAYIEAAVASAMAGTVSGVVTAPIHKEALHLAGSPYPGHTEMLAALTGAAKVCMMMASDEMIVSLATIHIGLAQVKNELSIRRIVEVVELTGEALRRLGKASPRIAVCGLNPHGGENGLFGPEEEEIIAPAVREAQRRGWCAEGPLVPDTAFVPGKRAVVDAYIAMHHDQGLIPFKMLAFETGVNVTLGLPIIRTSVDHGTAFDIAWQGKASASSMLHAIRWALRLSGGASV
jgi:4-hydroxythreonine-4-phosphate dehydrogenase